MAEINEIKDGIQDAAFVQWRKNLCRGTIAGATGMGKSRIAVMAMEYIRKSVEPLSPRILILVPTEELRDKNWPEEIRKWCKTDAEYEKVMLNVRMECYASAHTVQGEQWDLVVLDEIHHMTDRVETLFHYNQIIAVLGLTATPPNQKRDLVKYTLISQYAPVVFKYTLDQGVDDGVVADFEIIVINEGLDNIKKNITGGTAKAPFLTTEAKQYEYLNNVCKRAMAMPQSPQKDNAVKFSILKRSRFIYNLPSKTALARELLKRLPEDQRIITFCGGIEQSRELFGENVYNSKDKKLNKLEEFKKNLDMKRLGVVNAVDEGHNIPDMDIAIIVQTNSNDRTIVQRIGRVVRVREGHKALVFVLCAAGTQDEFWVKKALSEFDQSKIKHIHSRDIYTGSFFENR
jgi:superfamily II DNA or RNA helicase